VAEIAPSDLLAVLLAGITLGSLYCLMSMGLTLQFSTLGLFNFSHASIIMLGAFTTWALFVASGVSYVIALGLAVVVAFGLGAVIHRTVIRPLETRAGELVAVIVATLGVNVLLENSVLVTTGARLRRIPYPIEGGISFGGAFLDYHRLLIMSTAIGILVAMGWMLRRTRIGLAMRAIAQDREAAAYAGIPIDRTYLYIVALASALAAVAGAFYGSIVFITPDMGLEPLTKAFLICVFGGLTSVKGTVVSAYIIGVLESFTALAVGLYWVPVVLFVFMMVVLVVRPFGLFGERF
jgi:branched-chain amino acid transport system permease protein